MRCEQINGRVVPYDLPEEALCQMLSSSDMPDFTVACEALSYCPTENACEQMAKYLSCKDKYRRLCVLKVIFRNPYSAKYIGELERAVQSDDLLFVENALLTAADHQIHIPDPVILSAVKKHLAQLDYALSVLALLSKSEENFRALTGLFERADSSLKQELIAEALQKYDLPDQTEALFALFSASAYPKMRTLAVEIGRLNGFDITPFEKDADGHVRKAAKQ